MRQGLDRDAARMRQGWDKDETRMRQGGGKDATRMRQGEESYKKGKVKWTCKKEWVLSIDDVK